MFFAFYYRRMDWFCFSAESGNAKGTAVIEKQENGCVRAAR